MAEALARGDEVTYFHRGRHGGGMHPDAEEVLGDRATDLGRLPDRQWDVVVDSARRDDVPAERMDPRVLTDGSRHEVYKRWFEPGELVAELGGGEIVHAGRWFVAVLA